MTTPRRGAARGDPVAAVLAAVGRTDQTFALATGVAYLRAENLSHHRPKVCCIPFFTYGVALGDVVSWNSDNDAAVVVRPGGHKVIRAAFADKAIAAAEHERLHGALVAAGCTVEFNGDGYCSVDIEDDNLAHAAILALQPFHEAHGLSWEWGT